MIATVLAEGDGGAAGYGAVASVIMNRAGTDGVGNESRVTSVIMEGQDGPPAEHQFAAVGNGVYKAAMAYPSTGKTKDMFSASQFGAAATAAEGHFSGALHDNTHGALNFFQGRLPRWAIGPIEKGQWEVKAVVGYHGGNVFFGPTVRP